ncbi:ABC transporter permease [Streptomyces reniochalinae]|uniref:ABC transporter permease n=2 Tax=Streptomyces reniochalinae TaxID=2250578 RepID=A0A367EKB7_9ACTN|nr:ABC transporter permease [Streptomyces reniochalinae]
MRPATLTRLAVAGTRTDALRVTLTALSALLGTLALLAAFTVAAIPTPTGTAGGSASWSQQYTSALLREPGLRPGVASALALLTLPVLALAGQCARIGAPARDRRLAALRLAGATPRQCTAVVAAETGAAALLGTCAGFAGYFALRAALDRPGPHGGLPLPTDVLPHPAAQAAVLLGFPLLSALTSAFLTRRVTVGPLGVARHPRTRTPRPWPALLLALGIAAVATGAALTSGETSPLAETAPRLLLALGGLCSLLGVILGTGWLSAAAGRTLHRFARGAPALLASRQLAADPWRGSRTLAAFLACLTFGAGAAAVRAFFVTNEQAEAESARRYAAATGESAQDIAQRDPFYLNSMDLVDLAVAAALVIAACGLLVALAESVVARHRVHTSLVASGVPRRVLVRAGLWQTLAPAVPAVLLALAVGTALGRAAVGTRVTTGSLQGRACTAANGCPDGLTHANSAPVTVPEVVRATPVPWSQLALYGAGALVALLVVTAAALLFLRGTVRAEELRAG